jgi:thiamine-phosphate pyrophosphorylase
MEARFGRMMDANFNRVGEGLRVVEDVCRFVITNSRLQQGIKNLRHRFGHAVSARKYIKYRDSMTDVGFAAHGKMEYRRENITGILTANFKRTQEGLRCLEETFKLDNTPAALEMKEMRYEAYDLEKEILALFAGKTLGQGLYLVMTEPPTGYEKLTRLAVASGIPAVQLRYKGDDDGVFLKLAGKMRRITRGSRTLFFVNDRPDIALMVNADGVHVGQGDLPVSRVRQLMGPDMLLGLSTHDLNRVKKANAEPVDYIGFGPLYATDSKARPDPVVGPEKWEAVRQASRHPVVAIGGLTLGRIRDLKKNNCRHVAVIREVANAPDPFHTMKNIQELFLEEQ